MLGKIVAILANTLSLWIAEAIKITIRLTRKP